MSAATMTAEPELPLVHPVQPAQPMQALDLNKRTAQYVQLRDKIARLNDEHKAKMAPYNAMLTQLNALLLGHLNAIGAENVGSASGVVYRTTQDSATVVDKEEFRTYIQDNEAWELVDIRANKVAVNGYMEANEGVTPPGVKFTRRWVVGVRRPSNAGALDNYDDPTVSVE